MLLLRCSHSTTAVSGPGDLVADPRAHARSVEPRFLCWRWHSASETTATCLLRSRAGWLRRVVSSRPAGDRRRSSLLGFSSPGHTRSSTRGTAPAPSCPSARAPPWHGIAGLASRAVLVCLPAPAYPIALCRGPRPRADRSTGPSALLPTLASGRQDGEKEKWQSEPNSMDLPATQCNAVTLSHPSCIFFLALSRY
jgi:hypothetical protein